MSPVHGIVTCGGKAERFAESVGGISPYPKHLEMLGDKPVLDRVVDGFVHNIPLAGITFVVNPQLRDSYLEHLKDLQRQHIEIPFSVAWSLENEGGKLLTRVHEAVTKGTQGLDGNPVDLGNPVTTVALGDSVITPGNRDRITNDFSNLEPLVEQGASFAIFNKPEGGLIYWTSILTNLRDTQPDFISTAARYELVKWNCNTREELLAAERVLLSTNPENEMRDLNPHVRKEAF